MSEGNEAMRGRECLRRNTSLRSCTFMWRGGVGLWMQRAACSVQRAELECVGGYYITLTV